MQNVKKEPQKVLRHYSSIFNFKFFIPWVVMAYCGQQHADTRGRRLWGNTRGVTLVLLLATMVIMGIGLAVVGRQWTFIIQRELEADLLAKGLEIQNALVLYSATKKP